MKRILLLLTSVFCMGYALAGDGVQITKEMYEVINCFSRDKESTLYVCKITLYNADSSSVMTWINPERIKDTSFHKQIVRHFGRPTGDFNLYAFLSCADTYEVRDESMVVNYLIKEVKPAERFSYIIVSETPYQEQYIENFISIIPQVEFEKDFDKKTHPLPSRMMYKKDELVIPNVCF